VVEGGGDGDATPPFARATSESASAPASISVAGKILAVTGILGAFSTMGGGRFRPEGVGAATGAIRVGTGSG
jgi:hypothetical protein